MRIWKHSHGTNSTTRSLKAKRAELRKKCLLTIYKDTAKGQGIAFRKEMVPGDFFYLCHGNDIKLFGQIISGLKKPRSKWVERKYRILKDCQRKTACYYGVSKWWTPNTNTTCSLVPENEMGLFEQRILRPFFKMRLTDLEQFIPDELTGTEEMDGIGSSSTHYEEARKRLVQHKRIETIRNRKLVTDAKKAFQRKHGKLFCEVCDFDFVLRYSHRGERFIEAHHSIPISQLSPGTVLSVRDLRMVCANCHRMLHVRPWIDVDRLRKELISLSRLAK
jgi:predicted HNH restriction endonuclease